MSAVIKNQKSDYVFDFINIILLIMILIIVLYPLIFVVSASFSNPLQIVKGKVWLWPVDFTLSSYTRVFSDPRVLTGYVNTIEYTVVGTVINIVMTVIGAYPLSRRDLFGRNIIMGFLAFTMFFSGGMIPTYLLIKSLGMMDTFWVMVIPGAVSVWNIIIMRTFFQNTIPVELEEAAFIDGCTNLRIIFSIVLPLSTPIIAVMVLFYGVGHWNAFFNALLFLKNEKRYPLQIFLREILLMSQALDTMDETEGFEMYVVQSEGIKYALIIVASVPVLMLYPFLQRYFVKGMMIGAIKG